MKNLETQIQEYINQFRTLPDGTLNPLKKSHYADVYHGWNWDENYDGKLIEILRQFENNTKLRVSDFNRNKKIKFSNPEKLSRYEVFDAVEYVLGDNWHTLRFSRNGIWLWLQKVDTYKFGY